MLIKESEELNPILVIFKVVFRFFLQYYFIIFLQKFNLFENKGMFSCQAYFRFL